MPVVNSLHGDARRCGEVTAARRSGQAASVPARQRVAGSGEASSPWVGGDPIGGDPDPSVSGGIRSRCSSPGMPGDDKGIERSSRVTAPSSLKSSAVCAVSTFSAYTRLEPSASQPVVPGWKVVKSTMPLAVTDSPTTFSPDQELPDRRSSFQPGASAGT